MANEQKTAKIRGALTQLDPTNDAHWTDDGLPRESVVRDLAADKNITRKEIQEAFPGFQRPGSGDEDPLGDASLGETKDTAQGGPKESPVTVEGLGDPTQNTGELMTEDEVRAILNQRVADAKQALEAAQKAVRDAQANVITAQGDVRKAQDDLLREFPPLTPSQNIKLHLASEQAHRRRVAGYGPGEQIDAAFSRSNARGWRRPARGDRPTQTSAVGR